MAAGSASKKQLPSFKTTFQTRNYPQLARPAVRAIFRYGVELISIHRLWHSRLHYVYSRDYARVVGGFAWGRACIGLVARHHLRMLHRYHARLEESGGDGD